MGNDVVIITDGVNDLSQKLIEKYDILTIPYRFFFGEETYRIWNNDKCTISLADFCTKLEQCSKDNLPHTSIPSPGEFHAIFEEALDKAESVIAIFQASEMAGTIQSAQNIANNGFKHDDITIFDTKRIMTGVGIQVLEAAKMAHAGKSKEEILQRLESINPRVRTFLIMNDLKYLYNRGRIGRAKKLLGTALNMIPSIIIDDGIPTPLGTFKGIKNLTNQLKLFSTRMIEQCETNDVFLSHINHHEVTQEIYEAMMESNINEVNIHYQESGPIMGVYSGPKAICISYIGNWNEKWLIR